MTSSEIRKYIERYRADGKKMFATSSFQTHSIPMLHLLSTIDQSIPIVFINTGFLFPETLRFKDEVMEFINMPLVDVKSLVPRIQQRDEAGNFYFTSDPDRCCFLNKTQPMEPVMMEYDVWINGIRGDQNTNRKNMQVEQPAPYDCLRFHPMLHWSSKMIYQYINEYDLPRHPLDDKGYVSIGCEPCTRKYDLNNERDARWFGMNKTECGLHTELVSK